MRKVVRGRREARNGGNNWHHQQNGHSWGWWHGENSHWLLWLTEEVIVVVLLPLPPVPYAHNGLPPSIHSMLLWLQKDAYPLYTKLFSFADHESSLVSHPFLGWSVVVDANNNRPIGCFILCHPLAATRASLMKRNVSMRMNRGQ